MKRRILLAATLLPLLGLGYADEPETAEKTASTNNKDFVVSGNLNLYSKIGYNIQKPVVNDGTNPTGSYSILSASVLTSKALKRVATVGYDLDFYGGLKVASLVADNTPQFTNEKKSIYIGKFVGLGKDNHYYSFNVLNLGYKKTLQSGNKLNATVGRFAPSAKFAASKVVGAQFGYDAQKYKVYALATLSDYDITDPKLYANKHALQMLAVLVPRMYAIEASRSFTDSFSTNAIAYYQHKDYFAVGGGFTYKRDFDIYATQTEIFVSDLTYAKLEQALDGQAYNSSANTVALKETIKVKDGSFKDMSTQIRIYKNFGAPNRSFRAGDFEPTGSNSSSDFDAVPNYATSRDGLGLSVDTEYTYKGIKYGAGVGVANSLWGVTRSANVSAGYSVDKFKMDVAYTIKSEITNKGYPVYKGGGILNRQISQGRNTLESSITYSF